MQERVGEAGRADRSLGSIRAEIPPPAAELLAAQRIVVVGARDGRGRVWCSLVAGAPGFARAPDARTVAVAALPAPGDPLAAALAAGPAPVGLRAIEPQTRRRMRSATSSSTRARGCSSSTGSAAPRCS